MTLDEKKALTDEIVRVVEDAGTNPRILRDLFAELSAHYRMVCVELDREHAALFPATQSPKPFYGGWI